MSAFTLGPRSSAIELPQSRRYLEYMLWRVVVDRNCQVLTELHSAGVPLTCALAEAVKLGLHEVVEHLLKLGVCPNRETLNKALTRGASFRTMFLSRVPAEPMHFDTALKYGHFDLAFRFVEQKLLPTEEGLIHLNLFARRKLTVPDAIGLPIVSQIPNHCLSVPSLRSLARHCSLAVFERAFERSTLPKQGTLQQLLEFAMQSDLRPLRAFLLNAGATFGGQQFVAVLKRDPDQFDTCAALLSESGSCLERSEALLLLDAIYESEPSKRAGYLTRLGTLCRDSDRPALLEHALEKEADLRQQWSRPELTFLREHRSWPVPTFRDPSAAERHVRAAFGPTVPSLQNVAISNDSTVAPSP